MLKVPSLLAYITLVIWPTFAQGQTHYLQSQIDPASKKTMRIRDIANKPCVTVKGAIKQGKINTAVVDEYIIADNICPKVIKIKACYTDSQRCVEFMLHSREHQEVLLGTSVANSSTPFFKFDFTEKDAF